MAEIPVEKKSSLSWLWWLLLIAGIIALLFWIFGDNDDEADLAEDPVVVEQTVDTTADPAAVDGTTAATAGAVTSLATLYPIGDAIGRDVDIQSVEVNRLVGDAAFTVGEGDNETLVTFDQVPTPNTATEGEIDVNPGSRVAIAGSVMQYTGDQPDSVTKDIASATQGYIRAENVRVLD